MRLLQLTMANEEHVELLKQDVQAWNEWRKNNPEVEVDLRGADLSGATLVKSSPLLRYQ